MGRPGPDWCQSHCYQQTGHRAGDKVKARKNRELLFKKNVMKERTGTGGTESEDITQKLVSDLKQCTAKETDCSIKMAVT